MKAWKQPVFIITALERQTVWVFYSLDMNHKLFNQFYFARAHKKLMEFLTALFIHVYENQYLEEESN